MKLQTVIKHALAMGVLFSGMAVFAAAQTPTASGGFRWEITLTGKLTDISIGPRRLVRTRCITAFEEIMATPKHRARLPEFVEKVEQPVEFAWNPNNLNYQSEYYHFIHPDRYELLVRCNLQQQGLAGMKSTFVVEARPLPSFKGGDLEDVARSHMAWIRRELARVVD